MHEIRKICLLVPGHKKQTKDAVASERVGKAMELVECICSQMNLANDFDGPYQGQAVKAAAAAVEWVGGAVELEEGVGHSALQK